MRHKVDVYGNLVWLALDISVGTPVDSTPKLIFIVILFYDVPFFRSHILNGSPPSIWLLLNLTYCSRDAVCVCVSMCKYVY